MSIDTDDLETATLDDLDHVEAPEQSWTTGPHLRPYKAAAAVYWAAGWRGVLPLPARRKSNPPAGYTGYAGEDPSYPDVMTWTEIRPNGNICLRLPPGVIGIDVDDYGTKSGGQELANLEVRLGPLPATWISTSRDDGTSGIRLFRAPAELVSWVNPGSSIEIIHAGWRYMVAAPSFHETTGKTYRWVTPDGQPADRVPAVDELPAIPDAWSHELGSNQPPAAKEDLDDEAASDWLRALPSGEQCRIVSRTAGRWITAVRSGGGRHDAMLQGSRALVMLGAEGHLGSIPALADLRRIFLNAARDDPRRAVASEWARALSGAIRLAAKKHPTPRPRCGCNPSAWQDADTTDAPAAASGDGGSTGDAGGITPDTEKPNTEYRTHDDIGNGNRLLDLYGHRFRYVTDDQVWRIWDGHRWDTDQHNRVQEAAKGVAQYMVDHEVEQLVASDPDQPSAPEGYPKALVGPLNVWMETEPGDALSWIAEDSARVSWAAAWWKWHAADQAAGALRKFAKKCRDMPRLNAMVKAASSIPALATSSDAFDQPGTGLLNVLNGTLDTNTVELRPHARGDMLTKVAPIKYNPHARAPMWQKFLKDNLPDKDGDQGAGAETRRYLQKLAGYMLTGKANEKLMAYLYGPSDTGKSLFVAVLLAMLGPDYALAAAKGVLAPRGHGDDGRDPDRHDMAGTRLVTTSESRPGEPMDEALVKALTGRDGQRSRGNYARGNESWTPEMLLMVCSNQLPRITGDDDAIWTRIKVIPFDIQFLAGDPRRDDQLQAKIVASELEGVLAWAVEGLRLYRQEGLADPAAVRLATERFRSDSDGVARFIGDGADDGKLLVGEGEWTERTALYTAYSRWANEAGVKYPLARDRFYTRMEHLGYVQRKREGKRGFAGLSVIPSTSWVGGFRDNPW
ncbi:phage/plasmid primase, P4 family [Micromonospora sp. NPDC049204]|uniref:phage/plasmid primase, P4 family n=1 Tax=Micromonospora sp. NPDC049204 TaxID=3154351 RepID=UPI0033D6331F